MKPCAYCQQRARMTEAGSLCEHCWTTVPLIQIERKLYVERGSNGR
jgi:hypothetical protein